VPYRLKIRAPSFVNLSILPELLPGCMVSDVPAVLGSLDFVMANATDKGNDEYECQMRTTEKHENLCKKTRQLLVIRASSFLRAFRHWSFVILQHSPHACAFSSCAPFLQREAYHKSERGSVMEGMSKKAGGIDSGPPTSLRTEIL